jgi:hypothetical protein
VVKQAVQAPQAEINCRLVNAVEFFSDDPERTIMIMEALLKSK